MGHGGGVLVAALEAQGVERVFCVPGESYLAALDGLYDSTIETIVTRNEGGAAMMAEADGKLTGLPGIAFVTRGPGATNASCGVHVAFQDSTPMILFIGQVASDQRDREAFQEVDYRAMFGPLAKWVAEIDRADRIPEYISRAFHVAQTGRPGPVVLALPEDMLSGPCDMPVLEKAKLPAEAGSRTEARHVAQAVAEAERPLLVVGGGGWSEAATQALAAFAEKAQIPVGASFRCQDYLDNRHPNYAGDIGIGINPKLAQRVKDADLIVSLGARLGEMTTSGYTLLTPPKPHQTLIHIHADPSEIGRVYAPDYSIVAKAGAFVQLLADEAMAPADDRSGIVAAARDDYQKWQEPQTTPGTLRMETVITHLNDVLADNAILTNGAGNYAAWLHRYYRYRAWRTQLAPTSGSMGYGLPASIAAKLRHPDRDVICLAGDGCFQMVMQEFGVACEYGANIVVLVSNNGMYGTIRMHQQRNYPLRPSGTAMKNPDFAALAKAYGAFGATVERDADFPGIFAQARAAGVPAILDLRVAPEALSPKLTLESSIKGSSA
ncbi:thiamine pyrophosphate-binding protein (plasmid) [Qingshengfaniella alkalisoli]|uniref:Thiamine pyrophosphate-binding protein n=1 Tax=Qingshengfaniella alkalisoli TaxID=2599296 RepID=A0A5B8J9W0_9RHOB|nr:thiamine pyrophosphate-binding protein [Qingshengfaniella alkalisoli]